MNIHCLPKRLPSAARFFTLCRLTVQPPQSYSVGGQRSSGQLTGKPAGARPNYRGRWCAVSRGHPGRPNPGTAPWELPSTVCCGIAWIRTRDVQAVECILHSMLPSLLFLPSSSLSNGVPVIRRWHSLSRLAPEGAPHQPGDLELCSALAESGDRRAELVKQLREAHSQLEDQAEHLRFRDSQLEASKTRTEMLALKHKQLETALSALEQEKEVLELTRFEETRRRGDLQDK
ncbi:UNVERIFIED_CONTAM: hypothetical protein FKN15_004483 [Acipenser sinensis]